MAKAKFYAIRPPIGPCVLREWEQCRRLVHGVSGACYRSFPTMAEAEAWAAGDPGDSASPLDEATPVATDAKASAGLVSIYVDGSFLRAGGRAGWAALAVSNGEWLWSRNGTTAGAALSRNIDGELEGALVAIEWARTSGRPVEICHDYEGIARWLRGEWKAQSAIARQYLQRAQPLPSDLRFRKVAAHTGDRWNEEADRLAREALLHKGS